MDMRNAACQYANDHYQSFLADLKQFITFPSVSTDPIHKDDMIKTAGWIAEKLSAIGMHHVEIIPTPGHPVVYADWLLAGESSPTVLIYGHYDVQPPDPLELWNSEPFDPLEKGDFLFARGASDMKGQIIASIAAVEAILKQGGAPVNLKFVIEGEEEIGSPNFNNVLESRKEQLRSTVALNPDAGMIDPNTPTIVYGLRGLAYFELKVFGPDHDLHSGQFGGVIQNPANALCKIISGMHDENGCITLPDFYDTVRALSDTERQNLSQLPTDPTYFLEQTGSPGLYGEKGYTPVEQVGVRPTLDVNGIFSGFTGKGSKTVIPAWAMAKVSMRLVPDQHPRDVEQQLRRYLEMNAPDGIRWELSYLGGGPASMSDPDQPAALALAKAFEVVWQRPPVYKREGGSVPIVADMQQILKIDSVLTGFGLPGDNIHSPNEKLHLPTWKKGIQSLIHFFYFFGDQSA